jgi:hypothetical protein
MTVVSTKRTVVSTGEMDDDTFIRHMNMRHSDSLGYLGRLRYFSESVMSLWRVYHETLHRLRIDLRHEHEEHYHP